MTREEAINIMNVIVHMLEEKYDTDRVEEAVEMAIKALEQEPCGKDINVPATDAISRQAVLDGVDRYIYKSQSTGTQDDFYSFAELVVKQLPSVTSQPKTGHWIKYSIPRCGEQHYKCTSCGYYINFGQWGELYTREFKYCPNCGARMVEPQESEKV